MTNFLKFESQVHIFAEFEHSSYTQRNKRFVMKSRQYLKIYNSIPDIL